MKGLKVYHLLVLVVMVLCLVSTQVSAQQLTYYYGGYSMIGTPPQWGGVAPTGTWATAEFIDDGIDAVQLNITVNNITDVESIGAVWFNYTGTPSALTITQETIGQGATATVTYGNNDQALPGDGNADLLFAFSGGQNMLQFGETANFTITGTGVSASSFFDVTDPSNNQVTVYSAVKLQGIPCTTDVNDPDYATCWNEENQGTTSAIAAAVVPEPISSTLFLVGAATLGYRRFRKNKNKTIA